MIFNALTDIVKVAPLLGGALGGPLGSVATSLLTSVFGGSGKADDLIQRISGDPEAEAKLKQIEYQHMEALQQMQYDDLADARKMQSDHEKYTGRSDLMHPLLACVVIGAYLVAIIFTLIFPSDHNGSILTGMQGLVVMVLTFYFGKNDVGGISKDVFGDIVDSVKDKISKDK